MKRKKCENVLATDDMKSLNEILVNCGVRGAQMSLTVDSKHAISLHEIWTPPGRAISYNLSDLEGVLRSERTVDYKSKTFLRLFRHCYVPHID